MPSRAPVAPSRPRIGCAGWSIPAAHAGTFPDGASQLERYAQVFDCVEINSSFYRPHQPATYRRWADTVPADFRFAVKMPKAISHAARLRGCTDVLDTFLERVLNLGDRLGGLLLQLPPSLAYQPTTALPFFEALRRGYAGPVACEPRHVSWFGGAISHALRDLQIARVAADPARWPRAALPAGDRAFVYLRLHGSPRMYYDDYTEAALERIAQRVQRMLAARRHCWCVFDNTAHGHATANALALRRLLARPYRTHATGAG